MMGDAGFTLVEVVTVVVVIGIAAAVAGPALRPGPRESAGAAARALRATYDDARSLAARRGVPVVVVLETSTDSFAVFAEPEGAPREVVVSGRLPLPAGGAVTGGHGGRAEARFTPLGRARADVVTLVDEGGRHVVSVEPMTGTVRRDRR
jgi:prepilin-type N-terminal cleavage/methylation domain-containing protein